MLAIYSALDIYNLSECLSLYNSTSERWTERMLDASASSSIVDVTNVDFTQPESHFAVGAKLGVKTGL